MDEISAKVVQWIIDHFGLSILIVLFLLSGVFKVTKIEVNPIGWIIGWIGKHFTKDVRKDVADLKTETNGKFEEVKRDRAAKIDELKTETSNKFNELKQDYNDKITSLKADLDSFEERTNGSIDEMKHGTSQNCELLKCRLDRMEESNDMQTVRQIKAHVLDFANSCMNKRRHTKKDFDNIIDENTQYEALVKKYNLVNDVYKEDFEFIMKVYHKCQEEGSFLNESDAGI